MENEKDLGSASEEKNNNSRSLRSQEMDRKKRLMINKKYMPVCLNVAGENCLVVGGGNIAGRKIKNLLRFDANVTCLSPELSTFIERLAKDKKIKHIKAIYSKTVALGKYKLVIAATDNEKVNADIASECKKEKILANVITGKDYGDVTMPAILTKKGVHVAISTNAKSCLRSKQVRDKLKDIDFI